MFFLTFFSFVGKITKYVKRVENNKTTVFTSFWVCAAPKSVKKYIHLLKFLHLRKIYRMYGKMYLPQFLKFDFFVYDGIGPQVQYCSVHPPLSVKNHGLGFQAWPMGLILLCQSFLLPFLRWSCNMFFCQNWFLFQLKICS